MVEFRCRLILELKRWSTGVGVTMEAKLWSLGVGTWRYPKEGSTKCSR